MASFYEAFQADAILLDSLHKVGAQCLDTLSQDVAAAHSPVDPEAAGEQVGVRVEAAYVELRDCWRKYERVLRKLEGTISRAYAFAEAESDSILDGPPTSGLSVVDYITLMNVQMRALLDEYEYKVNRRV